MAVHLREWLIVIPARLSSQRLPRKPLADLAGKPMIVRVFDNLKPLAQLGAQIVVAVDHSETFKVCEDYGVPVVMTAEHHLSGTDRCHEVAHLYADRAWVLNVQGDEPFINTDDLIQLMTQMMKGHYPMGTLGFKQNKWAAYNDPNIVKIVLSQDQTAIYFSRASVPYDREQFRLDQTMIEFTQHLGTYAFSRTGLINFCQLPSSVLEQTEKLEQLRAVSAGWKIYVAPATTESIGIDTPYDLELAREVFRAQ